MKNIPLCSFKLFFYYGTWIFSYLPAEAHKLEIFLTFWLCLFLVRPWKRYLVHIFKIRKWMSNITVKVFFSILTVFPPKTNENHGITGNWIGLLLYLFVTHGKLLTFSWPWFFQVYKSTVLVTYLLRVFVWILNKKLHGKYLIWCLVNYKSQLSILSIP